MSSLDELAKKHDSDKGTTGRLNLPGHNYTKTYDKYFLKFKDEDISILEIGVRWGNSMRMWKDYFSKAKIYGMDIVPACLAHKNERVDIFIVDATDKTQLKSIVDSIKPPSIIIDDGSHKAQDIITSLYLLKRHMPKGGLYFIEDLDPNQDKEMVKTYIKGLDDMKLLEYIPSEAGYGEELVVLEKL